MDRKPRDLSQQINQSIVRFGGSQLECARVLHESLLVPVLTYGGETMIWKEKETSKIRVP